MIVYNGDMNSKKKVIIEKIFAKQKANGCWIEIEEGHAHYPACLHYVPTFNASLWVLIMLADLQCDHGDPRITAPFKAVSEHLFDEKYGIYSLKESHFPIPCLNGNMLYLDCYFNDGPGPKSRQLIDFFNTNQRFDDGTYNEPVNEFCSNKSCYGKHTCYWSIVKLLKGLTFIPEARRNEKSESLKKRCIDFILLHNVCFSSRKSERFLATHIDKLTFPNMYKADFLEILWLLALNKVQDKRIDRALELLISKQTDDVTWPLERKITNIPAGVGAVGKDNVFVSERAAQVLAFYKNS